MAEIENNKETQQAEWDMSGFEYDYDITFETFPAKEYIESFNVVTNFKDYTYKYAQKEGFEGEKDDLEALAKYIFKLGKTRKVPLGRWENVQTWLTNMHRTTAKSSRKNVYLLCFALGLNATETKEFFLKAYLERPFNYKDISEAVYFFCMNNGLGYNDAKRIIKEIEDTPFIENEDLIENTQDIGYDISVKTTEKELVKYLVENRSSFAVQSQTATEKLKKLVKDCNATMLKLKKMNLQDSDKDIAYAEQEKQNRKNYIKDKQCRNCGKNFVATYNYAYGEYCSNYCKTHWFESKEFCENDIDKINIGKILTDITGFYSREIKNGKATKEKTIQESRLPQAIAYNFPLRNDQFDKIWNRTASFDFIRRALIILKFYNFFGELLTYHSEKIDGSYRIAGDDVFFEEFRDETNIMLAECGYVQLYWRNPYDWIFGYCAWAHNPLTEFKNVIYEFYLKDLDKMQK